MRKEAEEVVAERRAWEMMMTRIKITDGPHK